jgi:hydrogenase expression/formation protein HypC
MCLGVPGEIVSVVEGKLMRMGMVNLGGVTREVCLAYVPEAHVGDYVVIHAGFAISQLDEAAARDALQLIEGAATLQP